jgi:hypothetical protein
MNEMLYSAKRPYLQLMVMVLLLLNAVNALSTTKSFEVVQDLQGQTILEYKKSYALLLGVSDYESRSWPDLNSVQSELTELESVLSKRHGFTVIRPTDTTSDGLTNALRSFMKKYGYTKGNRLLVYFSGHGYTRKGYSKGYLVPSDAPNPSVDETEFLRKAIDMSDIMNWAQKIEAQHAMFMFDSCFSGTIFATKSKRTQPPKYIQRKMAKPVRYFVTAGSAHQKVPAKSAFTPAFVNALEGEAGGYEEDGYLTGTELGLHLQKEVANFTGLDAQFGAINDIDLSQGDFIFRLASNSIQPNPAPLPNPVKQQGSLVKTYEKAPTLELITEPSGAELYLNDVYIGTSPATIELKPERIGNWVEMRRNSYSPHRILLEKQQKKHKTITSRLRSKIHTIESEPLGAKIYLDNDYLGVTPMEIPYTSISSTSKLIAKLNGYKDYYVHDNWRDSIEEHIRDEVNTVSSIPMTKKPKQVQKPQKIEAQKYHDRYVSYDSSQLSYDKNNTAIKTIFIKNDGAKDISVEFTTHYKKGRCGAAPSTYQLDYSDSDTVDIPPYLNKGLIHKKEKDGARVCYAIDFSAHNRMEFDDGFFSW